MSTYIIVPFFIPHMGCPFCCAFCNQWRITGQNEIAPVDVAQRVNDILGTVKGVPERIEVAFFGGSFTGLSIKEQIFWLEQAYALKRQGVINGIRLSTRPDYISKEIVQRLLDYGVTTIELGVQSLVDEVLEKSLRGHTSADTFQATDIIREYPVDLIYQLMLGLPGDNSERARYTAEKTVQVKPDGVRIYPAVVLKDTALAEDYAKGLYKPWNLSEAVEVGARWLGLFSAYNISVIRLGLQANEGLSTNRELIAGPYHPAYGEMVKSRLMLEQLKELLKRNKIISPKIVIKFNSTDYSKVVGHKRTNAVTLKDIYPDLLIEFSPDSNIDKNDLVLEQDNSRIYLSRKEFLDRYRIKMRVKSI